MRKFRECLAYFNRWLYKLTFCSLKNEKGQTLVEYGLLLILIAVVVMTAVAIVGGKANNLYSNIGSTLPRS